MKLRALVEAAGMNGKLANGCVFVVLLFLGLGAYSVYVDENTDFLRVASPDGQFAIVTRLTAPRDERDAIRIFKVQGENETLLGSADQSEFGGESIYWTEDSSHFIVVGDAELEHDEALNLPGSHLGHTWVYLFGEAKGQTWSALEGKNPSLSPEKWKDLSWPAEFKELMAENALTPSPSPEAKKPMVVNISLSPSPSASPTP